MDVFDVQRIIPGISTTTATKILYEAKLCSGIRKSKTVTERDVRLAARFYIKK